MCRFLRYHETAKRSYQFVQLIILENVLFFKGIPQLNKASIFRLSWFSVTYLDRHSYDLMIYIFWIFFQVNEYELAQANERDGHPPAITFSNGHLHTACSVIPATSLSGRYIPRPSLPFYRPRITGGFNEPHDDEIVVTGVQTSNHAFINHAFIAEVNDDAPDNSDAELLRDIHDIRTDIADIKTHFHSRLKLTKVKNLSKREWRTLAMVIDRCFFIFMVALTIISCTTIFVIGLRWSRQSSCQP